MSFEQLKLKNEYRSSIDSMLKDFYVPILGSAVKYDRAVGFFSSTALAHIADGIIPFVKKGGHIRLVASPILSQEDIDAIKLGYKKRDEIIKNALARKLEDDIDSLKRDKLNLLSNLIADGMLDIRIALTENNSKLGIYHEKMGVFYDEDANIIAFSGSMNETVTAMAINYEAIDVFCSWKSEEDTERIKKKEAVFQSIWDGVEPNVVTIEVPELKESIIQKYRRNKVDYEQIKDEDYIIDSNDEHVAFDKHKSLGKPRIPNSVKLHKYQEDAVNKWMEYGSRGIFDMATGTGKTYTGLAAVATLSESLNDCLSVIIACPYQHLVEQWTEDIVKFGMTPIVGYGSSKEKDWKRHLENAVRDQKLKVRNREFFCFITTNATFASSFVQQQIGKIRSPILLLVDEAHNFGANNLKRLLTSRYDYRLALSATLDRHCDPEGTRLLLQFFGEKCIEYSLEKAIHEDKLTPYKYYPIIVSLSEAERENYDNLTRQIGRCIIKGKNGKQTLSDRGKKLALQRARLVAGAIGKLDMLRDKIAPYIEDSYILVYCGAASIMSENDENMDVDDEELRQIDAVTDILGNELNMKVSQFTSKEDIEERNILKREFEEGDNLQALIAIKCLDEGVNIPKIKVAFILASTTNPKEYIQRRGRVLRKADGKKYAEIYDFITLPRPLDEVPSLTIEQMNRELALIKNELVRAIEFASLSMNKAESLSVIEEIKEAYDLSDEDIIFEEEFSYE